MDSLAFKIVDFGIQLAVILFAISFHESAHAYAALKFRYIGPVPVYSCPAGATLSDTDRRTAVDVREALRALVIHNTGGPQPGSVALAPLRRIAEAGQALATLGDDGRVRLEPSGDSLPARLLGLLLIVKDAQDDGTWEHLKACANEECRWAFYDRSRNHGGTWCEMATCGNKLKNREFRARKRG